MTPDIERAAARLLRRQRRLRSLEAKLQSLYENPAVKRFLALRECRDGERKHAAAEESWLASRVTERMADAEAARAAREALERHRAIDGFGEEAAAMLVRDRLRLRGYDTRVDVVYRGGGSFEATTERRIDRAVLREVAHALVRESVWPAAASLEILSAP